MVRPRAESAAELRLEGARLAVEATDFFLLSVADWFVVAGGGSMFGCADEFAAVSEAEVSGVAVAAFSCIRWSGAVGLSVRYLSLLNIGGRNVKRIRSRRGVCRSRSFS